MATNKRKRTENSEPLAPLEEAEKPHWITRGGQEEVQSFAENCNVIPEPDCIKGRSEEYRQKTLVLAMAHLLVFASKRIPFHPRFQKSVMASIRSIRRFLSSSTMPLESLIFQGILAAMPALLCHKENLTVVRRTIALLGDMALHSYQSMVQIVYETRALRILLCHLNSRNTEVQYEACHSIASIASGTQGQRALCDLGAVQKLMHLLLVVTGFVINFVDQGEVTRSFVLTGGLNLSSHTQFVVLSGVLEALDMLTCSNFCQSLGRVFQGSRVSVLKALQIMWEGLRNNCHPHLHGDHVRVLAKMIVWLAMEQENLDGDLKDDCENIVDVLFGGMEDDFKHFCDEHWENSPFLMHEGVVGDQVRSKLLKAWHGDGDSFFLRKLLSVTLACPPFSCDELETLQIYNEIEKDLGRPLVFGQDIRLVKSICTVGCTEPCSSHTVLEKDYHRIGLGESMGSREKIVRMNADVITCVRAYELGYTIALRGLEFRCSHIAAIAEALAVYFGQATVGANLYMTPSNAQGFKLHHDDHCVLVWQLTGWKTWKLWTPEVFLPRLYSQDTELERVCMDEEDAFEVSLKEGNILYIPRGFPHAACTHLKAQTPFKLCCECTKPVQKEVDGGTKSCLQSDGLMSMADADSECSLNRKKHVLGSVATSFPGNCICMKKLRDSQQACERNMGQSLHITFGVEVEPPFDWEGLIHMSLQCWATKQNWDDLFGRRELAARTSQTLDSKASDLLKGLLHVAVRQCGDRCSAFRKACLIAAKSRHKEAYNSDRFELVFKELIQNVASMAAFKEALNMVLTAIDTPASISLDWMHWLCHLSGTQEPMVWRDPVSFFHDRLIDCKNHTDFLEDMEARFTLAKESFVSCASYAQACDVFVALLHKYRIVRVKYTKGMLALHV